MNKHVFFGPTILSILGTLVAVSTPALAGWELIYLHPAVPGTSSAALEVAGGEQVGFAMFTHAALWNGTPESFVDLHPPSYPGGGSTAFGISGGQQAGWVRAFYWDGPPPPTHAALWSGTPESFVDLHPPAYPNWSSVAYGTSGGQQVGSVDPIGDGWQVHASLWSGTSESWVDLHPSGYAGSVAADISDGQQVGDAFTADAWHTRASLWSGTAASWVNLHPAGANNSHAFGVYAGQQVGSVDGHASLWSGTATSWVDLHPDGSLRSSANDTFGGFQVGQVDDHAALWGGTADSWVDLHAFLAANYSISFANGIEVSGSDIWIAGWARETSDSPQQAVLWHYVIPEPGTLLMMALLLIGTGCSRRKCAR